MTANPLCILAGVSSRRRGIATSPQCGQAAVKKLFGSYLNVVMMCDGAAKKLFDLSVYWLCVYFQFELRDRVITLSGRRLQFTICL
jgi:hypothetical protein